MKISGGEIIKNLRKNMGVGQKELAAKLFISQQKLSRIEAGEQEISIMEFLVAFEVLGTVTDDFWIMYLSYDEFEGYVQYMRIQAMLAFGTVDEICDIYPQFFKNPLAQRSFMSQFFSFISAIVTKEDDTNKLGMLYDALKLSIMDFDDDNINNYRLTYCEVLIINEIALLYADAGEINKAILLLNGIYENMNKLRLSPSECYMLYPKPLVNLYNLLIKVGEYERAAEVCNCTLDKSRQYFNFTYAPRAAYDLAVCYKEMGKSPQEYMPFIKTAYYAARAIEQHELANIISKEYKIL